MPQEHIDTTTLQSNGKRGEPTKSAFEKTERNFSELFGDIVELNQGRTTAANKLHYFGAEGKDAFTDLSAKARELLDDATAAAMLKTLGLSDYFVGLVAADSAATFFTKAGAPLQTAKNDATPGRILTAGAGGLLGSTPTWVGNINDVNAVPFGRVFIDQPTAGMSGTFPTSYGILTTYGVPGDGVVQEWQERSGSSTSAVRTYKRYIYTGQVGAWKLIYDHNSAVGTVSQSGGIPTGALIESGSNANGDYWRFAGGLQICKFWRYTNIACGAAYPMGGGSWWYGTASWNYPASFAVRPFVTLFARAPGRINLGAPGSVALTGADFFLVHNANETIAMDQDYLAVGRWY